MLYQPSVPGTPRAARIPFASPWQTVFCDRVTVLKQAQVAVTRRERGFTLEASVPLAALGWDPLKTPTVRGDVGRVLSDQTGTDSSDRVYWSNQDTRMVSDLPSEARLQPNLWGTLVVER
ncbi:MAG: hypothetical protein H0W72_10465 [Planctomycetes bacterium]|nr:hypothetical protein [Planctomycetota bacterium]